MGVLYDTNPKFSIHPLAKFVGNRQIDKDTSVFQSFNKAKVEARKRIKAEIESLEKDLASLEITNIDNCPEIRNPFY